MRQGDGMDQQAPHDERFDKVWRIIKEARSALLVTVAQDGSLDSRPMGCIQGEFDGTISFLTFAGSPKLKEIAENSHVLVSYSQPSEYEYVSLSGRARVIADKQR